MKASVTFLTPTLLVNVVQILTFNTPFKLVPSTRAYRFQFSYDIYYIVGIVPHSSLFRYRSFILFCSINCIYKYKFVVRWGHQWIKRPYVHHTGVVFPAYDTRTLEQKNRKSKTIPGILPLANYSGVLHNHVHT